MFSKLFTRVQLKKNRKMLFNKTALNFVNSLYVISEATVCQNEVVLFHYSHHVHVGESPRVLCIVGQLVNLLSDDRSDIIIKCIQTMKARRLLHSSSWLYPSLRSWWLVSRERFDFSFSNLMEAAMLIH